MSDDVRRELIANLGEQELTERLVDAAQATGLDRLDDDQLRHLLKILTSPLLVATSLVELVRLKSILDARLSPDVLRALSAGEADAALLRQLLALPDHASTLGDKCLFESGVVQAGELGPEEVDELGKRSYREAARVLELLSEDSRLRRFYDQNALDARGIEDEVRFLKRCSELFGVHSELLRVLLSRDLHSVLSPTSGSTSSSPSAPEVTALTRTVASPSPATEEKEASDVADGETRRDEEADELLAQLSLTTRTKEELHEADLRMLLAAEKTALFTLLDTERLREELKRVVIHQEAAIDALCDELSLYSTGTQDPRRPASYFLVGPTGVGKNYLIECLLRTFEKLWGFEVPYLELEGPEYTYPSDINELKGASRGFIRSDEDGVMTQFHDRAKSTPFSVILIDEVEKAHPQLSRFFLPIMDRGVMTDNRGRTLHFHHAMIFFTSNVGYSDAQRAGSRIGYDDTSAPARPTDSLVETGLRRSLSPEFINRVHLIRFEHLTLDAIRDIFDLELEKIRKRYREAQGLEIALTDAAREELIRQGFSPDYGARNLSRVLNRHANIEVSKTLKRDAGHDRTDVLELIQHIRDMREGTVPMDLDEVRAAVEKATRIQVDYGSIRIDFREGAFAYDRAGDA